MLPGYPHVGPGNEIAPKTSDNYLDNIARKHDIAYSSAKKYDDIRAADDEFIRDFKKHTNHDSMYDWVVKQIGLYGIATKRFAESQLGLLYPHLETEQQIALSFVLFLCSSVNKKYKRLYNHKKWQELLLP